MQEFITNKTIEKLKYDLVREGLISYDELSLAEETSKKNNNNLAQVIIKKNLIPEEALLGFIEAKLHIPYVNLDDYILDDSCLKYISYDDAQKYKIIPLFMIEDVLTVAMADPLDLFAINNFVSFLNCNIEPIICSERSILEAIEKYYFHENKVETIETGFDWREQLTDNSPEDVRIQKIIQAILFQALTEGCQEIYLEPVKSEIFVKFRRNTEILDKGNIPVLLVSSFVLKLKKLSGLDPSIFEIPQLGKIKFYVDSTENVASISTFPSINGERIVLKIYKPPIILDKLPINADRMKIIKNCLNNPGIIVVYGSELAGKTSVIYSLLTSINNTKKNIMTVESIVKYELEGIKQCQLNEKVGFDLDKVLKTIEYQSPDVLYIENVFTKEGLSSLVSLAQAGKVILIEFSAQNYEKLSDIIDNYEIKNLKSIISCLIFIETNDKIQIML